MVKFTYRLGVYMKRKKISTLLALLLGVSTFGACTNSDKKVDFANFWLEDALNTSATIEETLTYDVKYEAQNASLVNYTLNYTDGTYTTTLVSQQAADGKIVYTYTTQLNITATYNLGEASASFDDTVTSTVKTVSGKTVSVKTEKAIPKELVFAAMKEINAVRLPDDVPVSVGQIIISNLCGIGILVVATSNI